MFQRRVKGQVGGAFTPASSWLFFVLQTQRLLNGNGGAIGGG